MATRYNQETDCDRQTSIRIAFVQKFKLPNYEAIVDWNGHSRIRIEFDSMGGPSIKELDQKNEKSD